MSDSTLGWDAGDQAEDDSTVDTSEGYNDGGLSSPGWFDQASRFFDNPVGYVMTAVLGWVVGTIINGLEWTLASFWGVVDFASQLVIDLAGAFLLPIARLFEIILGAVAGVQSANASIVADMGVFSPVMAALIVAVEVLVVLYFVDMVYQMVTEMVGGIPFVGGLVTAILRTIRSVMHTIRGLIGVVT